MYTHVCMHMATYLTNYLPTYLHQSLKIIKIKIVVLLKITSKVCRMDSHYILLSTHRDAYTYMKVYKYSLCIHIEMSSSKSRLINRKL